MSESAESPELAQKGGAIECSSCGSSMIIRDYGNGEVVCSTCGRVLKEKSFDRGPEWRAYDQEEREKKSRAGPPRTETMHDRGLSTEIDYRNRDARGESLSPEKKVRMSRVRKWHRRGRIENARDRNLIYALKEVGRLSSQLGLPQSVEEGASRIYRKTVERGMTRGRSMEGMAAAAVYIECRRENVPRTLVEVAEVSPIGAKKIEHNQRFIEKELDINSGVLNPATFVSKFGSRLNLSGEARAKATELAEKAWKERLVSGRSPPAIAAGALYIACLMTAERRSQEEVADAADVTEVTVRNSYRELEEKLGISLGRKGRFPVYEEEAAEEKWERKSRAEEIEVENIRYENVVASVTFEDTELNLEEVTDALGSPDANYNPDRFPGVSYFQEDTEASFLVFESGKANCVGTTSVEEAREASRLLAEELADEGLEVDPDPKVEIQNIVVRADLGTAIDLVDLYNSSYETSYDPGSFPGLHLELDEPDADFVLFTSGQAILHVDKERDVKPAFEKVSEILREFTIGTFLTDEEREVIGWLEKNPRFAKVLEFVEEGAKTCSQIAEKLGVKEATAEQYVRECDEKGVVELEKHSREIEVKITEKGEVGVNQGLRSEKEDFPAGGEGNGK